MQKRMTEAISSVTPVVSTVSDGNSSCNDLLIFRIVLLQQCRCIETIGASAGAGAAADAVFDFFHVCLPRFAEEILRVAAAQQYRHSGAVVDGDFSGAGQTVTAATAKVTAELLLVLRDHSKQFLIQHRGLRHVGDKFLQFAFSLDAPNRHHMVKLFEIGESGLGIFQYAAGQTLHCHKTNISLFAGFYDGEILFRCQIAEGELQHFIKPRSNDFLCNGREVIPEDTRTCLISILPITWFEFIRT